MSNSGTAGPPVSATSFTSTIVTSSVQPSASSTSINRVTGSNPSAIYGTLSSNGNVVLVNPSGITVGAGAVVDTAGFTASSLQMSTADAQAGRLRFAADGTAPSGAVTIQGNVIANNTISMMSIVLKPAGDSASAASR